jgi:hypothetical protein
MELAVEVNLVLESDYVLLVSFEFKFLNCVEATYVRLILRGMSPCCFKAGLLL